VPTKAGRTAVKQPATARSNPTRSYPTHRVGNRRCNQFATEANQGLSIPFNCPRCSSLLPILRSVFERSFARSGLVPKRTLAAGRFLYGPHTKQPRSPHRRIALESTGEGLGRFHLAALDLAAAPSHLAAAPSYLAIDPRYLTTSSPSTPPTSPSPPPTSPSPRPPPETKISTRPLLLEAYS
jgi:hypothetical protein